MIRNLDAKGIGLKILFDGYDFSTTPIGKILTSNAESIIKNSYSNDFSNWKEFLDYCKQPIKYINNIDGYYTGKYSLSQSKDSPWADRNYILFNNNYLEKIYKRYPEIKNLEFWVCPSFYNGECDGIGFRVINPELVQNAFKWLFMSGNNMIYGKDTVDVNKECYIVEGFRDYVALKESGYNVIGLGSVRISDIQEKFIDTLKDPVLLLDNDKFGLKQTINFSKKYKIATLIQTPEKDAWDSYNNGIEIKIARIE